MKKRSAINCTHPFKYINILKVEPGEPVIGRHPIKIIHLHCIQCDKEFVRSPILQSSVKRENALGG